MFLVLSICFQLAPLKGSIDVQSFNNHHLPGITNFDLLGSFGEVKWLGNYYLVLLYNAVVAVAASLCLFNKFTARVRQEIFRRFALVLNSVLPLNKIQSTIHRVRETGKR